MADRSIVYRLIADVSQFKAQMASAAATTTQAGTAMETTATKGGKVSKGLDAVGVSGGMVAAALGTKVVMSAANFEQAMSSVQAATRESEGNMSALEQAAIQAGERTKFSATEAAGGIEALAKAGVSTGDILGGGLTGALDLAAAGNLEVGQAAEIAATALTQFNLAGEDVPHVADLLAAGAGKAQGDVSDLAQALNQSGLVASQMGLSLEETTGTLSAFASAGLLGSDAGTSFRTMLLRMANPTKESATLMRQLGISAYDASGQFVGTAALAGQLQGAFRGMGQAERDAAMATIFGSDAIRAANVLYDQGASGISGWTSAVDDSGFAAEQSAIMMDNLKGSVEELMGAFESAMIKQGQTVTPTLQAIADAAGLALDAYSKVDSGLQKVTGGAQTVGTVLGGPLTMFGSVFGNIKDAVTGSTDATEKNTGATKENKGATEGASQAAADYARRVEGVERAAARQAAAMRESRKAARDTATSFVGLGDSLDDAKVSLNGWLRDLEKQAADLRNFRRNAEQAAEKGLRQGLIAALQEAGPEGARRMSQLANATREQIGRANRAWEAGQREVQRYTDAVGGVPSRATTVLDVNTGAAMQGINNLEARLNAIADEDVFVNIRHRNDGRSTGMGPDGSYATGGYTGSGGKYEPAGVVHRGEYVFSSEATRGNERYLESLHHSLRGYATGGLVAASSAPSVNVGSPSVRVFIDGQEVRAIVRSEQAKANDFDRMMSRG